MDKYLREAIEDLLLTSHRCSTDNLGFIQFLEMEKVAMLYKQYEKYRRKHGFAPLRVKANGHTAAPPQSLSASK
jgi:hypothetical protein